jgi:hypothetical protein
MVKLQLRLVLASAILAGVLRVIRVALLKPLTLLGLPTQVLSPARRLLGK